MADNFQTNSGSGGKTFASDEIESVNYQRIKLVHGADGVNDGDVSSANPLPVDASANAVPVTDNGGSLTVDGTVNLSATDNAVLDSIATNTGSTATAVQLLDNAISGNEMQVDIVASLPAGTNNIGDVDIASALPAGTNVIGDVGARMVTSSIQDGTTAATPKFAAIDDATSGNNTLVAAVASKKLRVLSYVLVAAGTVNARFESGANGTALTGQMNLVANTGVSSGFNPLGHFETAANTLLNLELSAAVSVDGHLTYVEVD